MSASAAPRWVGCRVSVQSRPGNRWVAKVAAGHAIEIRAEHLVAMTAASAATGTNPEELATRLGGLREARAILEESEQLGLVTFDGPSGALRAAPVFAAGTGRSGGKLLSFLLSAHSRLWCPPFNMVAAHAASFGWDRRPAATFAAMGLPHSSMRAYLRTVVENLHAPYARAQGKPRVVNVSLMLNGQLTGFLDELYERKVRWIFVWRHAMDQIDSACRSFYDLGQLARFFAEDVRAEAGHPHVALARFWATAIDRQRRFQQLYPERTHVIRYEDLAEDPSRVLRSTLAFLGEEWEEGLLERAFQQKHSMGQVDRGHEIEGSRRVENDRKDRWHKWPKELIRQVAPLVNDGLEATGYPRIEA